MGTIQKFVKNVFGKKSTPKKFEPQKTPKAVERKKHPKRQFKKSTKIPMIKLSNNRKQTEGRLLRLNPYTHNLHHGNPIYSPKRTKLKGYQKCG